MFRVDLRSDTVTKPTPEMRRVMAEAEVGDDVFAEDPTVRALEERVADLLGKEAAIYVPSGTMANQLALAVNTETGCEIFCSEKAHIFNYEAAAVSVITRAQLWPLAGDRGVFSPEEVEARIRPDDHHFPPSRIIEIENTTNGGGGFIWPLDAIAGHRELANKHDMFIHLDGARLWNAAAESGIEENVWASYADTVSVCFSKGLGAPVGSAVAGTHQFIDEAHRWRKRLGGGMRQAGIVAAGALYGIDSNRKLLRDDHARAKRLAVELNSYDVIEVDMEGVQTNILWLHFLDESALEMMNKLAEHGVGTIAFDKHRMRLVTHLDVDDAGIDQALQIFHELISART